MRTLSLWNACCLRPAACGLLPVPCCLCPAACALLPVDASLWPLLPVACCLCVPALVAAPWLWAGAEGGELEFQFLTP